MTEEKNKHHLAVKAFRELDELITNWTHKWFKQEAWRSEGIYSFTLNNKENHFMKTWVNSFPSDMNQELAKIYFDKILEHTKPRKEFPTIENLFKKGD